MGADEYSPIRIKELYTKLNIMVVGDKIEEKFLKEIYASKTNILSTHKTNCKKGFTLKQDVELKWTYEIFEEGLSINDCEEVGKRIEEHHVKNDVIICFIYENSQSAKDLIEIFNDQPLICHPFIIFVSQDILVNEKAIKEYIEDNDLDFDFRNLRFINFNERSKLNFMKYLWEFCCYYNELGQELKIFNLKNLTVKKNFKESQMSFLLIGKSGRGKSTFINVLNNKKVAKESTGKKITSVINKYSIKNYNINLIDFPGISGGQQESPILLKQKIGEYYRSKKQSENIKGIFYFFNATDTRDYDSGEKNVISFILDLQKRNKLDIYFIINFASNSHKGKNIKQTQNFIIQLKSDLKSDFGDEIKKLEERIFPINIINTSETDEKNCFGLDKLFGYLYNQYKSNEFKELKEYYVDKHDYIDLL